MISIILHFIVVLLGVVGCLALDLSLRKQAVQSRMAKQFFSALIFFTLYHAFLSVPVLALGLNEAVLTYGYVGAIIFLFLTLVFAVAIETELLEVASQKRNASVVVLFVVGVLVTAMQMLQLPAPYSEAGFIFWNASFLPATLTSLSVFFVMSLIVAVMVKKWPKHFDLTQKIKAVVLNAGFLMLAFSGLIYYPSHNLLQTKASFVSGILGAILMVISLLIKKHNKPARK
jgi:hypothetical protein